MLERDSIFVLRNTSFVMAYEWLQNRLGTRGNKEGKPTQAALARHLGVPDNYITKLFNKERGMQIDEIIPIARFFNISAEEVLTGKPSASHFTQDQGEHMNQADLAIYKILASVTALLLKKNYLQVPELDKTLARANDLYRGLPLEEAEKIVSEFRNSLTGESQLSEKELIYKLLELAPVGSA